MLSSAPWRPMLLKSLDKNHELPYAKFFQLATVRANGRPANRTVVFRGFLGESDDLTFVTDRRSQKVSEVAANRNVQVCWYFPSSREQYRLSGVLNIIGEGSQHAQLLHARQDAWTNLSDSARSQYVWPHPGQPCRPQDEEASKRPAPAANEKAAVEFCLGIIQVTEVDHVDYHTFKRTRFSSQEASEAGSEAKGSEPITAATSVHQQGQLIWTETPLNT